MGSSPTGEIGVTLTPQSGTATVLLNGAATPINACIADAGLPAASPVGTLSDCAGHVLAISASIGTPGALTPNGATFGGDILVNIPTVNPITLVANPPVSNSGFTVPVSVLVQEQAGILVNPTTVTFNWTLGQPTIAVPATATLNYALIGSDTFTVTSDKAWATIAPVAPSTNPSGAALSNFTVGINLAAAGAPTTAGTYTAHITATGTQGETPAVTTVTFIVAPPPALTVGSATGTVGTPGTPATTGQSVSYTYGSATNPTVAPIPMSVSTTTENPTLPLTYSAVTYSTGATGWLTLVTPPSTINNSGASLNLTINATSPAIAPGTYTAAFTVTETDGNVPTTYTSAVTYTVTLNVNGTLSATAANSLFTYVIGTNSNDLPVSITSQPSGVTFNISTTSNLAASIMTGATPNTPQITVNGVNVTTPGQATGSVTVSAAQSALNCVASATVTVAGGTCSVTVSFNLNIHSSFFTGESLLSGGSGFYNLPFFGTYAYFPSQLAIYHTTLGEELLFTTTDASHGIYFYDVDSGHIWYTNPSDYPNIYDFNLGTWLYYVKTTGNGTAGSRQFYNYATGKYFNQ